MMFFAAARRRAPALRSRRQAASSSARSRFGFIVAFLSCAGLPAGCRLDQVENAGVVDGAVEALRAGADRAEVDVGAAMGFVARRACAPPLPGGSRRRVTMASVSAALRSRLPCTRFSPVPKPMMVNGAPSMSQRGLPSATCLHQAQHARLGGRGLAGALRVAVQQQRVVMVGGGDDQRVLQARIDRLHLCDGGLERVVEATVSCSARLALVACSARSIRPPSTIRKKPFGLFDSTPIALRGHLGQAGSLRRVAHRVDSSCRSARTGR